MYDDDVGSQYIYKFVLHFTFARLIIHLSQNLISHYLLTLIGLLNCVIAMQFNLKCVLGINKG